VFATQIYLNISALLGLVNLQATEFVLHTSFDVDELSTTIAALSATFQHPPFLSGT